MKKLYIFLTLLIALNITLIILLYLPKKYSEEDYIRLHYETESATLVSPHSLREIIESGDSRYIIVDARSRQDYIDGHIIGSINIPGIPNEEILVDSYTQLMEEYPDREILVYCYTSVCMLGRKVGRILARNGIYVRELGIGFNEWKNYWKSWNYEPEWDHIDIDSLIEVGEGRSIHMQGGSCTADEHSLSC